MNSSQTLASLMRQFPKLEDFSCSPINRKIFRHLRLFIDDPCHLAAAMVQNPFGKTDNIRKIEKKFGRKVAQCVKNLNKLQNNNKTILQEYAKYNDSIIIFLINLKVVMETSRGDRTDAICSSKILYASRLLKKMNVGEIHQILEDKFFSFLYPDLYNSYFTLLKFTRKKYLAKQEEINIKFEELLAKNDIKAKIEMRLKTISSIHRKVIKKDLLFSQVLDVIGLRIIVSQEEDCYRSMVLILKNTSIITNRIKDYIAAPKKNGYQSIHLTIMYGNYPVEIQIRTQAMHWRAQYGKASHVSYKNK